MALSIISLSNIEKHQMADEDEIEVTQAMLDAGFKVFEESATVDEACEYHTLTIIDIYRAMERVKRRERINKLIDECKENANSLSEEQIEEFISQEISKTLGKNSKIWDC